MKKYLYVFTTILLIICSVMSIHAHMSDPDYYTDRGIILAKYAELLSNHGIDPAQADFPLEAKRRILEATRQEEKAVIAGYLYRDLDGNEKFDPGEELSATLLGLPEIDAKGILANAYFNCYWFDPLSPGKNYRVRLEPDGIEPVNQGVKPGPGLNIFHIRISPVKPLIYITPHSHFDPEWEMTYEQYLKIEIPQIQQRLDLLQKDPAHCFLNDEECVTRPFVQRSGSRYVNLLRQGMSDGMIEPKGLITQGELTMPYGESIIRGITNGERMLSDLMGKKIRPAVFSSIDQYGYSYQIPQILKKAGRDYFLVGEYLWLDEDSYKIPHTHPDARKRSEYWLEGMDGSKVLVYRDHYYRMQEYHPLWGRNFGPMYTPVLSHNSALNFEGTDFCPPNLKLTAKLDSLNKANGPYKYILSSTSSFFRAIESSPDIPTITTENFMSYWCGVYESRVDQRLWNRRNENMIYATETLSAIAGLKGMRYPGNILDEAWYLLLINQDHDPMMGPMFVPGLYEGAVLPRSETAGAYIDASLKGTLNWLTTEISTDQKPGTPVIVFNPSATVRSVVAEVTVPLKLSTPMVTDLNGKQVPAQVVGTSGAETSVAFLAGELPATGWKTYYISEPPDPVTGPTSGVKATETRIENELLRIELEDGLIRKITDKTSGEVVFREGQEAGINEVMIWKDEGCISRILPADRNGVVDFIDNPEAELTGRSSQAGKRKATVLEAGPVRGVVQVEFDLEWGHFVQKVSLDAGERIIRFIAHVEWDAKDRISDLNGRRVRLAFNSEFEDGRIFCDIPFGVVEWEQSEQIRPVNSWMSIENGNGGSALCHKGPHSVQVVDDVLYMTLFRSVVEPPAEDAGCGWDSPEDEAAENGKHSLDYSLYIYPDDWKKAQVPNVAAAENASFFVKVPARTPGMLPGEHSCIAVEPEDLVVTAVKPTEYSDSGLIVRLFNPTDRKVSGKLTTGFPHKGASLVNFREELIQVLEEAGSLVSLDVAPFEIITVLIKPEPETETKN